ncbi:hypothetical protein [Gynuella sunshinyii]|uniref:Scaffold protein FimL second domain-containing protein n=1 Tax=Gynuella sunshinyii YC6258 TaxID=1445510 RepID=A0A0C5V7K9_9GAMM|nr:hypothetical protein [Gynuella sunshinyii]AJQ95410.1 hypothetical Protein YC6258_03374 [Gynuella sunshinyii YC6258]
MSSTASFKLVHEELENTIQEAQKNLETFLSDPSDIRVLESAIDEINQVRGTFVMLEDKGGAILCEEFGRLLTELPVSDIQAQNYRGKVVSDAVTQTLLILGRYFEYLGIRQQTRPEILLPSINRVRKARGLQDLRESYFYNYTVTHILKPRTQAVFKLDQQSLINLRKYRHIYQASFLFLLKGERTRGAFKYMHRAVSQVVRIAANSNIAPMFWLAACAIDCMAASGAQVGPARKLTLAQIDRQIRLLITHKDAAFQQKPAKDLIKELLYIIVLCKVDSPLATQIKRVYKLPDTDVSDHELSEQIDLLNSPGQSVMQSVSTALSEEILNVKEMVDNAARNNQSIPFSAKALHAALIKITDILKMVGLVSPSNVLRQQADMVGGWADRAAPSTDQLLRIADAVLYAESAIGRLSRGAPVANVEDHINEAAGAQLREAKVALIDEASSGLATAKRSITAFIDSNGDTIHLANVKATLAGVKGALVFLGSQKAAQIVQVCSDFVEKKLLSKQVSYSADVLEHLADALSSMEFFIETTISDDTNDMEALKVASHAAAHLR